MGSNYEKYKEQVKQILKELEIFNQKQDFCAYAIEMRGRHSFVVLFIIWEMNRRRIGIWNRQLFR